MQAAFSAASKDSIAIPIPVFYNVYIIIPEK